MTEPITPSSPVQLQAQVESSHEVVAQVVQQVLESNTSNSQATDAPRSNVEVRDISKEVADLAREDQVSQDADALVEEQDAVEEDEEVVDEDTASDSTPSQEGVTTIPLTDKAPKKGQVIDDDKDTIALETTDIQDDAAKVEQKSGQDSKLTEPDHMVSAALAVLAVSLIAIGTGALCSWRFGGIQGNYSLAALILGSSSSGVGGIMTATSVMAYGIKESKYQKQKKLAASKQQEAPQEDQSSESLLDSIQKLRGEIKNKERYLKAQESIIRANIFVLESSEKLTPELQRCQQALEEAEKAIGYRNHSKVEKIDQVVLRTGKKSVIKRTIIQIESESLDKLNLLKAKLKQLEAKAKERGIEVSEGIRRSTTRPMIPTAALQRVIDDDQA